MIYSKNQHLELNIEKITSSGRGLARRDGAVFFVPYTAPGDLILAKITSAKKNFYEAEIIELIQAGAHRTSPKCPHYGICGGCNLQHLTQEGQLEAKESILQDAFRSLFIRKIKDPELLIQYGLSPLKITPIQKNPQFWNYRNRIQPIHRSSVFYFSKRNGHDLEPIGECAIAEEKLNTFIGSSPSGMANGRCEIRLNQDLSVEVYSMGDEPEGFGFSQVNRFQNQDLINYVLHHLEPKSIVYDLYAGSGNFTFPMANKFTPHKVIAVELSQKLAELGTKAALNTSSVEYIHMDVKKFLQKTELASECSILIDPPRIGCDADVMKLLAKSNARQILYISCNPSALARDLSVFFESLHVQNQKSWKIKDITPFEMFSQTDHLETIVHLEKV